MKPHRTMGNVVVHPKGKRDTLQTAEAVYEIPCKNCPKSYIGETGRLLFTRLTEHKSEAINFYSKSFIRPQRKASSTDNYKLAIAEHVTINNHVIGWEESKVIDLEADKSHKMAQGGNLDKEQGQHPNELG